MKEFLKKHEKIKKILRELIRTSKIPFLIPIGTLMNARKLWFTPKSRESDSIGVLGRGVSLAYAGRLNFLKDFIIVNTEVKELKIEPVRSLLKGKRIVHMVNIGEGVLPAWYLLKYNIYKYVISRLKPDGSDSRIRSPRKVYATEKFGFKTDFLPEGMVPYLEKANNTGVIAVAYAAVAMKKKNVYVVGMDFYETGYLTGPLSEKEMIFFPEAREKMINYINDLIAKCPDTNFHFITASSFKCSLSNAKVENIKPPIL
jgi:hypothetical protein